MSREKGRENVSLSWRTVARRVEDIAGILELELKNRAADFDSFSLALGEICNVRDTAQLLILHAIITNHNIQSHGSHAVNETDNHW